MNNAIFAFPDDHLDDFNRRLIGYLPQEFIYAFTEKWVWRFMDAAKLRASWSKDPRTQVGAVIVNTRRQELGYGFNGFARGVQDTEERLMNRELKLPLTIHAEENAILSAEFGQTRPEECLIFVTHLPCASCMSKIIQKGLAGVVAGGAVKGWEDHKQLVENIAAESDTVLVTLGDS